MTLIAPRRPTWPAETDGPDPERAERLRAIGDNVRARGVADLERAASVKARLARIARRPESDFHQILTQGDDR